MNAQAVNTAARGRHCISMAHTYKGVFVIFLTFTVMLLETMSLPAAVWQVPADSATIQGALDVAEDGDEIYVAPGVYQEFIRFNGKAVRLVGDPCDPCAVVLDGAVSPVPNVATVVTFWDNEEPNSVLEGFTIQGGRGTLLGATSRFGGGIVCVAASPTIRRCRIVSNEVTQFGGGLLCESGSWPRLSYCDISDNKVTLSTRRGGGIYCTASSVTLDHCRLQGNQAGYGGALVLYNKSSAYVTDCVFENNIADREGGAVYAKDSYLQAANCRLNANTASTYGGGLLLWLTQTELNHCMIIGNRAQYGAGVHWDSCQDSMVHYSVVAGNNASVRGGGGRLLNKSNIDMRNCVFWNNVPQQLVAPSSTPVVEYSLIEGGYAGGFRIIDADPCFVSAGQWGDPCTPGDLSDDTWIDIDYAAVDADGLTAYRPELFSPVADSGDPNLVPVEIDQVDGVGNPRYSGFGSDMGVYELNPQRRVYNLTSGAWQDSLITAVAQANAGDELLIAPGRHPAGVTLTVPLTIRSLNPTSAEVIEATVLDAADTPGPVVTTSIADEQVVELIGLTMTGGTGEVATGGKTYGGGVLCPAGTAFLKHCKLTGNTADYGGAVAALANSDVKINNCVVVDNTVNDADGAVVYVEGATAVVSSCTIHSNDGSGGAAVTAGGACALANSIIWDNGCSDDDEGNHTCAEQIVAESGSSVWVMNCQVEDGWDGDGVDNISTTPTFTTTIDDNDTIFDPCDDTTDSSNYQTLDSSNGVNLGDYDYEADPCLMLNYYNWDDTLGYLWLQTDPCNNDSLYWYDLDFTGNARKQYCCIDIGAYEARDPTTTGLPHVAATILNWYCTIQEAIDNSYESGTVTVGRGIYKERVSIDLNGLRLRSSSPQKDDVVAATIIDAEDPCMAFDTSDPNYYLTPLRYSVVTLEPGKAANVRLEGLTLRGGVGYGDGGTDDPCDETWKGGAVYSTDNNGVTINRCSIFSNRSDYGGGVYMADSDNVSLIYNKFMDNSSTANGGAVRLERCDNASMSHNIISKNWTDIFAGAVYAQGCKELTFDFNTVVNNVGGIWFTDCNDVTVQNSIFWDNLYHQVTQYFCSDMVVRYCDVMDGYNGPGNINADPCFVRNGGILDPNTGIWVQGDYHLKTQALSREKAYGGADFTDDGRVNLDDFAVLAQQWGWDADDLEEDQEITTDLDSNDVIDIIDLILFAQDFLGEDPCAMWQPFASSTSPCVDAGLPDHFPDEEDTSTTTWQGDNNWVNMGVYGGTAEASPGPENWSAQQDLDNDGYVDLTDWSLYVQGNSELWSDNLYDFNRDEVKDIIDLTLLGQKWLWQSNRLP